MIIAHADWPSPGQKVIQANSLTSGLDIIYSTPQLAVQNKELMTIAWSLNHPAGFLALSVTHLTSDPPIITISIGKSTSAIKTVISSNSLAVNYIRKSDLELVDIFSGKTNLKGSDRFDDKRWDKLSTGSPILKDAVSVLDCCVEETIERYDTLLILAKIVNFTDNEFLDPMIHFRGKFDKL